MDGYVYLTLVCMMLVDGCIWRWVGGGDGEMGEGV